ncbi:MAG: EpsG family protein, partial [Kiritimatiellae bacterium]|nr:EpsG family protein [Kiritimatiellia bacterium]
MTYIVATLLSCAAAFAYERRRSWRWLAAVAAVPLLLVAAARWNVGTDLRRTYLPEYRALEQMRGSVVPPAKVREFRRFARRRLFGRTPERVCKHFKKVVRRSEPAYRLLMEGALRSGLGFRAVLATCALISAACVFFAIFRFSRWPALAVFLYVATGNYFLSLNVMRQYVAVGIGLVAVAAAIDRRPWRFVVCVAAATAFHYSAVLLLPLYALSRVELNPRRGAAAVAAAVALSFVAAPAAA